MTDKQCDRCGEVNPAEIHTCTPKQAYPENFIDALRYHTAISEQPEPEPVAWMYNGNLHEFDPSDWAESEVIPLYAAPPQREWQGLTDEDIRKLSDDCAGVRDETEFIRAIEAALKAKNG